MPITNHYDLDIDTTLGGNNASDYVIPSQKAIKDYVDNSTGGNVIWGNIAGDLSNQTDLASALNDKYDASNPSGFITGITSSDVTTALGYTPYNSTNPNGYITISALNGYATETWVTNQGYITGITSSDVTTALGYTPYDSSNPNGYTTNVGTVTSVNNVSPINGNVSLTIPTVNNATLTITQGGVSKGTFTANASSDVTIALDAGGGSLSGLSDVTLTAPASGQVLEYNGSNWVNANSYNRNIGEIVTSTIPLTDAGLHLLDGALISGLGSYADFVTYIAGLVSTYPDLFETEANWQTAVTTYGVCGKFVYDSVNNTVRLPKYSNKIYTGGGTAPVVGNGMSLGITDGTLNGGMYEMSSSTAYLNCAQNLYGANVGTAASGSDINSQKALGVTSDPDKSGIIADLTNITTSLDGYYYIVVATSSKTDIQVDIDEIAADLNGKADTDLSNVPTSKGILSESYVNGTSWYRVYSDGWCEQGGNTQTSSTTTASNITFLKPFTNTNYTIVALPNASSSTSYAFNDIDDQTASGCIIRNPTSCYGHMWVAYGYIR